MMNSIQDLIEEAKIRTLWWALCIFAITYLLSHTSKSMWANAPIAVLLVCALRILLQDVEFHLRVRPVQPQTYLSYLQNKQLSVHDPRLTNAPPPSLKKRRKIDSPLVEAALNDFVTKVLQDFVLDLWYAEITPDKDAPDQMRILIIDALGEIAGRLRDINLVDLLTRDIIDLVGNHFDLYRRNQSAIGVELMGTLSLEERDEKLKQYLMAAKELHPALVSPDNEYKVLQRLMGGLLAVVLRPQEAHSPVVRCIARELLTCLVIQPVLNLASPAYINEAIELGVQYAKDFLYAKDGKGSGVDDDHLTGESNQPPRTIHTSELSLRKSMATSNQHNDVTSTKVRNDGKTSFSPSESSLEDHLQSRHAGWGSVLEAATQRRSEVLTPENLENMWTRGSNYKTKRNNNVKARRVPPSTKKTPGMNRHVENLGKEISPESHIGINDKALVQVNHGPCLGRQCSDGVNTTVQSCRYLDKGRSFEGTYHGEEPEDYNTQHANENKARLKRSSSTSDLIATDSDKIFSTEGDGAIFSEFYSPEFSKLKEDQHFISSDMEFCREGILNVPKLRCRVVGAYFENTGSTSFAVYSIAVTDACNNTWFVKRRYRNFERLHRHLKDIPNYTLHLPPKRFLSSSIDDSFVHQRCIQLDQYLQDLLSVANIAEQHEVWDFLSASSKSYSHGRSTSVMKTLAVNVDDAMDDILRQVKGVSDGLMRKVVGSSSIPCPPSPPPPPLTRHITWNGNESSRQSSSYNELETSHSLSDNEEHDLYGNHNSEEIISGLQVNDWHSDNELDLKEVPPRVIKSDEDTKVGADKDQYSEAMSHMNGPNPGAISLITSGTVEDPVGVPPEWTPPNVSVPMLNLVDKIFQLSRRGWLRRQVFWFSKQILQLVMEDAIDDWLLSQIQMLRRDDTIALGIRLIQDILWPDGTFFLKLAITQRKMDDTLFDRSTMQSTQSSKLGSFEEQLEAVRRANDVKKMIFDGAPTALVSLIGHRQYKRSARDIYYFIQSNICVKQLTYEVLELLLITVFPELRDLVIDIHEKM